MKKRGLVILLIFILLATTALAATNEQYHLKLLAVQENANGMSGSDADLYLELIDGSGRVFLETFPLTKLDTQISTRYAKDVACNHFKLDCEKYDFIYTIKARSNIIGGPSAGAAISALTAIAVLDLNYDTDITITATINSGGIIGPVGGVKEKLEAASKAGLKKVMIAEGSALQEIPGNETENATNLSLIDYGHENLTLEVVEVIDLDTVLLHLTGVDLNHKVVEVTENEEYSKIMSSLQKILCDRAENIEKEIKNAEIEIDNETFAVYNNRKEQATNASKLEDHYSAASFCFVNNILLKNYYYKQKEPNKGKITNLFSTLEEKIVALEKKVEQEKIETISDLQTFMVVKERINDVKVQIKKFKDEVDTLELENMYGLLAYAEERFFSAISWAEFFAMDGKKFVVDEARLQNTCMQKISESEERYQYAALFLGTPGVNGIKEKMNLAKAALEDAEFSLCLIKAAQAKADASAILSTLGVSEESIDKLFLSKQKAVERIISENSAEGVFPILGYSYYQYAISLQEQEPYTALVYLEYALEMSELGIYFPEEKSFYESLPSVRKETMLVIEGFVVGFIVAWFVFRRKRRKEK